MHREVLNGFIYKSFPWVTCWGNSKYTINHCLLQTLYYKSLTLEIFHKIDVMVPKYEQLLKQFGLQDGSHFAILHTSRLKIGCFLDCSSSIENGIPVLFLKDQAQQLRLQCCHLYNYLQLYKYQTIYNIFIETWKKWVPNKFYSRYCIWPKIKPRLFMQCFHSLRIRASIDSWREPQKLLY